MKAMLPGLVIAGAAVGISAGANYLLPSIGILTWSVILGVVLGNSGRLPDTTRVGLGFCSRKLLRVGVVLLGFSLSFASVASLGWTTIAIIVTTLLATFLITIWMGRKLGLGRARSLLIATGFAICGASAIAAMEENAEADADDVAAAIAMVTLFGTVAMIVLPLLQHPLDMESVDYGVWVGASVHEIGQVVAAAGPAGAAAVSVAVAVKLTRVLLLAPIVAGVSILRRREARRIGSARPHRAPPPLVPGFVLAFLVCVTLRSLGMVPIDILRAAEVIQTVALAAALFGMGTGVQAKNLARDGASALLVGFWSTLLITGLSLGAVLVLL